MRFEKSRDLKQPTGYILPNGDWYPCKNRQHDKVAQQLVDEGNIPKMKIGGISFEPQNLMVKITRFEIFCLYEEGKEPTQKQIDTIFDYCQANEIDFPSWISRADK